MRKLYLTLLLISAVLPAVCQVDLKNSLPDLKAAFYKSKIDTQTVKLALTISSFYLTNKGSPASFIDSSLIYRAAAENLSSKIHFEKGINKANILKARVLILQGKIEDVNKMAAEASGSLYCWLHFVLGKFFLDKAGEEKSDLDLADSNFTAAEYYADKNNMPGISLMTRAYGYQVLLERGVDPKLADQYFFKLIERCKAYKNKAMEAQLLEIRGIYEFNGAKAEYLYKTIAAAKVARDTGVVVFCLKEIADYNLRKGNLDTAENQLKNLIRLLSAIKYKNRQYAYDLLAAVYTAKGNFEAAMSYGLTAAKYAEQTGTDVGLENIYYRVANICKDMGLKKESMPWYQKCLDETIITENRFRYVAYWELATELIAEGRVTQVLKTLDSADNKFPNDRTKRYFLPLLRGDCYMALGKPDIAEGFYLQVITAFNKRNVKDGYFYTGYKNVAAFYIQQKAFLKATRYIDTLLIARPGLLPMTDLAAIQLFKFKIDSARGDYLGAIKHFEASKFITDSIFNHNRLRQTEQLQLQYATAKRDHENLVLRNRDTLQQTELEKDSLQRKMISGGLIGAMLFIALMVYLYRAKQKANIVLKSTQGEIKQQNSQLTQLVNEKEWLMKEIHHRVKNNLQIISSLLNTQTSFLDNEQAITAIRDSQNRMQAISFVHQKLYQSEDLATVSLRSYIEELAYSIRESFQALNKVRYVLDVAEVLFTTAESVPLGLILNEAITNCVKYAFSETQCGVVFISLVETEEGEYKLTIRDNGKGLPENFDIALCTSLGMSLMMGLTEQLSGKFLIESDGGTIVTIIFPRSPVYN